MCFSYILYKIDISTGNFIPKKVIFIAANVGMLVLCYIDTIIYG